MNQDFRELQDIIEQFIPEHTARERALMLLEQFEREFDIYSGVAHDLRSPLSSIIGFSKILSDPVLTERMGLSESDKINDVKHIHDSSNLLLEAINDFVDYMKLMRGRLELAPETFNLPAFLELITHMNLCANLAPMHAPVKTIHTDRVRLQQVFTIILRHVCYNALPDSQVVCDIHADDTMLQFKLKVDYWQQGVQERNLYRPISPQGLGVPFLLCRLMGGELFFEEAGEETLYLVARIALALTN